MRTIDIIAASLGLVLLSPLLLMLALLVKITSSGPVFHRGIRVGRDGRIFCILKFRSMVADAEKQGPAVTPAGDSRVTKVGRLLRRYKLDELPQLINVLRGDMSLVGPRPEDPQYVALYNPEQRRVLAVRPGITSVAVLSYRNEEQILHGDDWQHQYVSEVMPHKLALELDYLRRRTIWSDLGLVLRTIFGLP